MKKIENNHTHLYFDLQPILISNLNRYIDGII